MGDERQLSRLSLRRDQILQIHFDNMPDPPPEMMKLPGVASWWNAMKLHDERRMQAFNRMVNNLQISENNTGS